jgi:hypothetical protein
MAKERAITQLELIRATVIGQPGWVAARWRRADGSTDDATVRLRHKTAERLYIAEFLMVAPTAVRLRDVPLARIEQAINADAKIRVWVEQGTDEQTLTRARSAAAARPRLKRPEGRRLDDGFYQEVAAAYRGAVANGLPPSKTLAEDSDTPAGTVNRWIAAARERGYLPRGEPGRVTV